MKGRAWVAINEKLQLFSFDTDLVMSICTTIKKNNSQLELTVLLALRKQSLIGQGNYLTLRHHT